MAIATAQSPFASRSVREIHPIGVNYVEQ